LRNGTIHVRSLVGQPWLGPFSGEWLSRSSVSLPCVGCRYRVNLNVIGILGAQLSYDAVVCGAR
jgi:hypothetical protein